MGQHRLIIAEKPSVGRDIARVVGARTRRDGFLEGPGIRVSWCVGHLAELCDPHEYRAEWKSWAPHLLPLVPDAFRIRCAKTGAKQFGALRKLLRCRDLAEVVNACDAGREGELIFRYVYELADARVPVSRLWISSLTEQSIRQGLASLRPGAKFDALADAARCRSEADWLVGMNGTRALTGLARRAGGDALMSVGRVQTPTLALIVRREQEIEHFVSQPYWQVDTVFDAKAGSYQGRWRRPSANPKDGEEPTRLSSRAEADAIATAVTGESATVAKVTRKTVSEHPPLLFDLTTLQKTANKRFHMTAQQTLSAAQSLYETHKALTYPRTDSRHLTTDMVRDLPEVVAALAGQYPELALAATTRLGVPDVPSRRMIDDREVGDHHAIIPTDRAMDIRRLNRPEANIYELVCRRFLAGLLPDAVFARTHIETVAAGHSFATDGRVRLERGWQAAEPPPPRKKPDPLLPAVEENDDARVAKVEVREGHTKPPKRYVDATLLGAMERADKTVEDAALRRALRDKGMGTPATRAAIIENLIRRCYVSRVANALCPTAHGRALIAAMPVEDLLSAELTGAWEEKLAKVARGACSRAAFMSDIEQFVRAAVDIIAKADGSALANLPALGSGTKGTPPRKRNRTNSATSARTRPNEPTTRAKPGKSKPPRRVPKPKEPPRCPACKQGRIIEGRRGWGCSRWKEDCKFVVSFVQRGVRLPPDEADRLFRRGKTRLMPGLTSTGKARLVLDLARDANVRLELGAQAKQRRKSR